VFAGEIRPAGLPWHTLLIVLRSRTIRIVIGIVFVLLAVALALWWMAASPPRWYHPPDPHDAEANELAGLVEHRLAEEIHKIREDDSPWRLRIREEQINAWLATRMPKWLEHEQGMEWPAQLGTPQVRFDPDSISIALPMRPHREQDDADSRWRMITFTLIPQFHESEVRFILTALRIGRLATPGDPVEHLERLAEHRGWDAREDELTAYLRQLLRGEAGLEPAIKLVDDRRVQLQKLHLQRGYIDISATTLAPGRVLNESQSTWSE
jgi:hypothetical protein